MKKEHLTSEEFNEIGKSFVSIKVTAEKKENI